ncbi:MAG TPA: DEAD/DEAH box helicase, partial [Myxococcota bacterium]|nr:DEAD/DEAH box helicase [Myxococcota bacterium]
MSAPADALAPFSAAARAWFGVAFAAATPVQRDGWARIAAGEHALLLAPTGSGKTLAAFFYAIDQLGSARSDAALGSARSDAAREAQAVQRREAPQTARSEAKPSGE